MYKNNEGDFTTLYYISFTIATVILTGYSREATFNTIFISNNNFSFTAPADYISINEVIGLPANTGLPGLTETCRIITIQNDNIAEGIEDFTVTLNNLFPASIIVNQPNTATVQILDNDSK